MPRTFHPHPQRAWLAAASVALGCLCGLPATDARAQGEGSSRVQAQVRVEARVLEWTVSNGLDFDFAVRYRRTGASDSALDEAYLRLPADPVLSKGAKLFFDNIGHDGDVIDLASGTIDGVIDTLETVGSVKILSQPSIILTSIDMDEKAVNSSNAGDLQRRKLSTELKIPYESTRAIGTRLASVTEYKDSGVVLEVAVLRVDDNLVTLDVITKVTELTGFINIGLNEQGEPLRVPTIDSRFIENRLIVPDRTVYIAGLMKTSRSSERNRGIPWISEIPVLNWFLTNKSRRNDETELVFLIKPEIMRPNRNLAPAPLGITSPGEAGGAR